MSIPTFNEYPYSYKNLECASFVLRTTDASSSNQYSTSNTWKNINLRTLMGNEMYDKYDMFLLKPIVTATNSVSGIPNWGSTTEDRYICFNIQGLPFTYNFNSSTMTKLPSGIFSINQTRISNMTFISGGNILTFKKFQELVDLTIFYTRVSPKTVGTYTNYVTNPGTGVFPSFVFLFMIYGVKNKIDNKIILRNSMFNAECAQLVLRSADLPVDTTNGLLSSNAVGSTDNFMSNMTWNNINLRTLLGSMYDKYDRFALVPTQIQSINAGTAPGSTTDDRNLLVYVSGLPFINNTYDMTTLTNRNAACINFIRVVASSNTVASSNGIITLFSKNQELVNLNIYYQRITKNVGGNYLPVSSAGQNYPHTVFCFNIYGVDKYDRIADSNGSRIF